MRSLTIIFVVTLVVVVAVPAAIGRVAASRQQYFVDQLSHAVPGTHLITDTVETGWITSRLRHRLTITDDRLVALAADLVVTPALEDRPVIFVDSLVAHGPWPLLDGRPGLARIRSILSLGQAAGPIVDIPGEVITDIGFLGGGRTRLTMPEFTYPLPGARGVFRITGVDSTIDYDRSLTRMRSNLEIRDIEVVSPRGAIETHGVSLHGDTRRSGRGLWTGKTTIAIGRFILTDSLGANTDVRGLELTLATDISDGLLAQSVRLQTDVLTPVQTTASSIDLEMEVSRLDATAVAGVLDRSGTGTGPLADDELIRGLIRAGPVLEIRRLGLSHGSGTLDLVLHVGINSERADEVQSVAQIISALQGTGRLTLDRGMLDDIHGRAADGQSESGGSYGLVEMGFLRPDDGHFIGDLEMDGGLLTINGLPVPLR